MLQKTQCKCRHFSVSCVQPGLVPPRVVVCISLRATTQRRSWRTLSDSVSVRSVSAPLLDNLAHHLLPYIVAGTTVWSWNARAHGEFAVSVTLHTFRYLLLSLHGSQGSSHAGANGLERKSGTFSDLWSLIMKSVDDDWEELRLSTFCDASFGTRWVEWASRPQGPQSTSSTELETSAL